VLTVYHYSSWRNHFARATSMKFNCFFLLPFMDEFPAYLVSLFGLAVLCCAGVFVC
jgi:hypothetical protein